MWNPPPEYQSALPPLGPTPPRAPRDRWSLPPPRVWPIDGIAPDGDGSRVRVRRVQELIDERWEIDFVDGEHPVRGGSCKILGWDALTVECRAEASPRELAPHGKLYNARVSPPEIGLHPDVAGRRGDRLTPLEPKHGRNPCANVPPVSTCNPPPPRQLPRHEPPVETTAKVTQLLKVQSHYLVRIERLDDGMNTTWTAVFVDGEGHAVPDGECRITDWDHEQLECESSEWIAQITPDVRLSPPKTALVTQLVKTNLAEGGIELTFNHGAKHGVEVGWRIDFLDDQDKPTGESCKIEAVGERMSRCTMAKRPVSNRASLRR